MRVAVHDDSASSSDYDITETSAVKSRRSILRFDSSQDPFVSGSASFSVIDLHNRKSFNGSRFSREGNSSLVVTPRESRTQSLATTELTSALQRLSISKGAIDTMRAKLLADADFSLEKDNAHWSSRIAQLEASQKAKLELERLEAEKVALKEREMIRQLEAQQREAEEARQALLAEEQSKLKREEEHRLKLKAERERKAQEQEAKRAKDAAAELEKKEKARLAAEARERAFTAKQQAARASTSFSPQIASESSSEDAKSKQALESSRNNLTDKPLALQTSDEAGTSWSAVQAEYTKHMSVIARLKSEVNPAVEGNDQWRKTCFNLKLKLKPKFGQLTNSVSQLKTIVSSIKEILQTAESYGEPIFTWMLNTFAKQLIQQAESESNVAVEAAVPLAMVAVLMWVDFPDLGPVLLARFVKKCPHVVGYCVDINTEQGRKTMGYKRDENGKWEAESRYNERMSGIVAVWSSMTHTKLSASGKKRHPYTIKNSWLFVARHLNRPAESLTETDFCVFAAWWDVTAARFVEAFGKQAEKLLRLASQDWVSVVQSKGFPSANRLRLLGQDWQRSGQLINAWKPMSA